MRILNVGRKEKKKFFTLRFYPKTHNRNTQFSVAGNFYPEHSRMDHLKNSFSSIGTKIWNSIPDSDHALLKYKCKDILQNWLLDFF